MSQAKSGIVILSLKELCILVPKENTFEYAILPLEQCTSECELYEAMCGIAIIAEPSNAFHSVLDVE